MRPIIIVSLAATTLVGAILFLVGDPEVGQSAFPGDNGLIVFVSNRDVDTVSNPDNREIYVMDADGGNPVRLTFNEVRDDEPTWAPDGSKIAFFSERDGNKEIYVMNADGSDQTRLTHEAASDRAPTWSPDGNLIAFQSFRDGTGKGEIYIMAADGSGETRLTNNNAIDADPAWSPGGDKIAFASDRSGNSEIHVMDVNGANPQQLTDSDFERVPKWAPDGAKIVFTSASDGNNEIYVIDAADGGDRTRLTDNGVVDTDPAWSPDGESIIFARSNGDQQIYKMDTDGSNPINISSNAFRDQEPDWQPLVTTPTPTVSPAPTPSPTPTPTASPAVTPTSTPPGAGRVWGDNNCSQQVDPVDSLLVLRGDAGLPTNTGDCPDMGQVVDVQNASLHPWGDVDCSGDMSPVDSLKILRFDAGLGVTQAVGCPPIDSEVLVVE